MKKALNFNVFRNIIIIMTALAAALTLMSADEKKFFGVGMEISGISEQELDELFVDMLIPFDSSDPFYTDFNEVPQTDMLPDCELANYEKDGLRSVLTHFRGAEASPAARYGIIYLPAEWHEGRGKSTESFEDLCREYKRARFILADKNGSIINISDEFQLVRGGSYIPWYMGYNAADGTMQCCYQLDGDSESLDEKLLTITKYCSIAAVFLLLIYLIAGRKMRKRAIFAVIALVVNLPCIFGIFFSIWQSRMMYTNPDTVRAEAIDRVMEYLGSGLGFIGLGVLIFIDISAAVRRKNRSS